MNQLDLFEPVKRPVYAWHLHGRYLASEFTGWPVTRTKRVVYHFDDHCQAETEPLARLLFEKENGPPDRHHQWIAISRGAEIKEKQGKPRNRKQP